MAVTPASNRDLRGLAVAVGAPASQRDLWDKRDFRDLPVSVVAVVSVVPFVPSVPSLPALPFLDAPDRLIDLALDLSGSGLKLHHI